MEETSPRGTFRAGFLEAAFVWEKGSIPPMEMTRVEATVKADKEFPLWRSANKSD